MPFSDVINNYANGSTGTLTGTDGETVGYTVGGNSVTTSRPGSTDAARISANGDMTTSVTFDRPVHGMTLRFGRSNTGEDYFVVIDGTTVNLNTLIANGDVIFTASPAGTYAIGASGGISGTTSNGANPNLGFLRFETAVTSVGIFGTGGGSGNFDLVDIGIESSDFRVVCFTAGTALSTPDGVIEAGAVQPGDVLLTHDDGPREVQWVQVRHADARDFADEARLRPVRIRAGALGRGLPQRDLLVSRQHRILIASRAAQRILGQAEVLAPAIELVGLPGIEVDRDVEQVSYHHILMDRHALLIAEGTPAESLFMGPEAFKTLSASQRDTVRAVLPDHEGTDMRPARPFPPRKALRKIVAVHARHARPLLEGLEDVASGAPAGVPLR